MPTGTELLLGLRGEAAIEGVAHSLGLKYNWEASEFLPVGLFEAIEKELAVHHKDAVTELGYELIDPARIRQNGKPLEKAGEGYVYLRDPSGVIRQTCIWGLQVFFDPHEMGEQKSDAVIGVSLVSRYFPVFLDCDKEHGGSGDPIELSPGVLGQIEIARRHLSKTLPFIKTAPIVVKEMFY